MSRDALKDAFIAGYHACENHAPSDIPSDSDIVRKFDHWFESALRAGVRDPTDANPDGWIEWDGSADMPPGLSGDTPVVVRCRSGHEVDDWTAGRWNWSGNGVSHQHQIVAYRVVRS